ncbi:ribose ABC transporter permease [Verrucomicrobiaceae bacterium SCGC AG-212-N21]|nr:ribose ABC transporter permease [Verrucomicrobiaceae bacterium SCGC AG-212-N21]
MKALFGRILPLLVAIAALLATFRSFVPNFLHTDNLLDLAQQISVNAILAYGMTLVILIGGIDLSVGALLALAGTVTAFCLVRVTNGDGTVTGLGLPLPAAVCLGLGVGLVFGLFHGFMRAWRGLPPFIITLATMLIARGLALGFNESKPLGIPDSHSTFLALGNGRIPLGTYGLPVPVLVMLVLYVLMAALLHFTVFGRHLYAIGDNRLAALYSGIRVKRCEVFVYAIAGVLTAVAGLIHTSQLYSAEPASGMGFELNAIAAAVVGGASLNGGRGMMTGTLLGAVIIGILDKGLNQAGVHFSLQYVIKGAVILIAVLVDKKR